MKIRTPLASLSLACLLATGCAVPDTTHMPGSILLDVGHDGYVVVDDGNVSAATKVGKATQESILGWITNGDSSIEAARKDGGIGTITHVDWHGYSILGIVGNVTTMVYGM